VPGEVIELGADDLCRCGGNQGQALLEPDVSSRRERPKKVRQVSLRSDHGGEQCEVGLVGDVGGRKPR